MFNAQGLRQATNEPPSPPLPSPIKMTLGVILSPLLTASVPFVFSRCVSYVFPFCFSPFCFFFDSLVQKLGFVAGMALFIGPSNVVRYFSQVWRYVVGLK